jgi:hypothetical protein
MREDDGPKNGEKEGTEDERNLIEQPEQDGKKTERKDLLAVHPRRYPNGPDP